MVVVPVSVSALFGIWFWGGMFLLLILFLCLPNIFHNWVVSADSKRRNKSKGPSKYHRPH